MATAQRRDLVVVCRWEWDVCGFGLDARWVLGQLADLGFWADD